MIIEFNKQKNNPEYNEQLEKTRLGLLDASFDLFHLGLSLALKGKWYEWSGAQSPDSEVIFNEEMLLDTGDDLVTRIIKLKLDIDELMFDVADQIKSPRPE